MPPAANQHKAPIAEANGHVCVCRGVDKETISSSIAAGASSFEAVKEATTAGSGCSMCEPIIEDILAQ